MNAISRIDLEEPDMKMTVSEFEGEKKYQSCMYFVRAMLQNGIIDEADFEAAENILREKYNPVTSYLLACNELLCVRSNGLLDHTKEERRCD